MKKKLLTIIALVMVLVTGLASLPALAAETETADSKKDIITWDLENGKTVTAKTFYPGYGMGKLKIKLKNYKDTETADGKREITFSLVIKSSKVFGSGMTGDQLLEYAKCSFFWNQLDSFSHHYFSVIDLETGACLELNNDKGVTVEMVKDWTSVVYEIPLTDYEEWLIYAPEKDTTSVRITAPKDYKDMAIIAGGISLVNNDITVDPMTVLNKFFKEGVSFYDIPEVSEKGCCHGIKVN